jgi:hypothetical protein
MRSVTVGKAADDCETCYAEGEVGKAADDCETWYAEGEVSKDICQPGRLFCTTGSKTCNESSQSPENQYDYDVSTDGFPCAHWLCSQQDNGVFGDDAYRTSIHIAGLYASRGEKQGLFVRIIAFCGRIRYAYGHGKDKGEAKNGTICQIQS